MAEPRPFDAALNAVDRLVGAIHEVSFSPEFERLAAEALVAIELHASEPPAEWAARLAAEVR